MKPFFVLAISASFAASCFAQGDPLSAAAKAQYDAVKNNLLKAADAVPADAYSYQPTPDVRTLGALIGHIADANYGLCGVVAGQQKQMGIEKSKTTKDDLVAALKDAFAFCDPIYAGMNDKTALETVTFRGPQAKLSVLYFNIAHNNEEYGYLSVYMRMKGIVPPSSAGRGGMKSK